METEELLLSPLAKSVSIALDKYQPTLFLQPGPLISPV